VGENLTLGGTNPPALADERRRVATPANVKSGIEGGEDGGAVGEDVSLGGTNPPSTR
jgi:hypothetical protein